MTRLFLDEVIQTGQLIPVTGEKAHYLCTVLRCKPADRIIVTDSRGSAYSARITALTKKQITIEITGLFHQDNESPLDVILVQGLLKGEKMDLLVQKATELGVTEIVPVVSERCQVRETRKLQRWQKIAEEASRQCRRNKVPLICDPEPFSTNRALQGSVRGIICWEKEGLPFSAALDQLNDRKRVVLCVGPEGGFSEKEVRIAEERGVTAASLGKRILRAETAAIAALVIAQYELGDLSLSP